MTAAPTPPVAEPGQPKKSRTWLIVLIIIIVLCCVCVGSGVLLWNFGDQLLQLVGLG